VTILNSKYGKPRQVLLHPTTISALHKYAQLRDLAVGSQGAPAYFVSTHGRLLVNTLDYTFARLVRRAGIMPNPGVRSPRLHDFRHYADGGVMCPAGPFRLVTNGFAVSLSA